MKALLAIIFLLHTVQFLFGHTTDLLSAPSNPAVSVSYAAISESEALTTKGDTALSINTPNNWPDTCKHFKEWSAIHPGADQGLAKLQYDTLRLYMERCAVSDPFSYYVFGDITGAVQLMSADTNRFLPYRVWLISVLYLNTVQEEYFCACMGEIARTFQWGKNAYLGRLTVLNYLRTYHRECWSTEMDQQYANDSLAAFTSGYDVTHLPLLDSLGLGFLLTHNSIPPNSSLPSTYLVSFTSSPNPFKEETKFHFHLNRLSYISIQIYDLLGHVVWESKGRSYDEGDHDITIGDKSLPEGTLYARISTGFGEVKTVKLIKLLDRD